MKTLNIKLAATPFLVLGLLQSQPAALAAPQMFQISATVVSTAPQIEEETALDFGTIVSGLPTVGVMSGSNADSSKITISPEGKVTSVQAAGAPTLRNVGTSASKGKYIISGFQEGTSIGISVTNESGQNLKIGKSASEASCNYKTAAEAVSAGKTVLRHQEQADVSKQGMFFCVDSFTSNLPLNEGNLAVTGKTGLVVTLGATLVLPAVQTGAEIKAQSAGVYTGKIGLEVTF